MNLPLWLVGDAQALLFLGSASPWLGSQAGGSRGGRQEAGAAQPGAEQLWLKELGFASRQRGAGWVVVEEC